MGRAQERAAGAPAWLDLDSRIRLWRAAVRMDDDLPQLLADTATQTPSIAEISVAGQRDLILASSTPARRGAPLAPRLSLRKLIDLGPLERFQAVLGGSIDYENRVELGVDDKARGGHRTQVFTIQVLVSSKLLRDTILPEVYRTALASIPLFLISVLLAWAAARFVLLPLTGISRAIEAIARGDAAVPLRDAPATREFAVVRENLRLLGEQVRGVSELRHGVERMIASLEESVLLFDSAGHLMVCGESVERMLGLARADIAGQSLEAIFPPTGPLGATLRLASAARQPVHDERVGALLLNLDPLPDGGLLVRLRNAEGREMVESQLSLNSRLTAITRLTGRVAHEIKNPLNSIALRLELLRARLLPGAPEAETEINVIAQEVTRLDRVVRTFLDFTRPVELCSTAIDLAALARELIEVIRPEADAARVTIATSGLDAPLRLRGDADLLKQAVMNILRNALDAMPGGGRLAVRLARQGGEVLLEVGDTGPGIPPETRERVFELYYSTKQKGSGIGLAMTYRALQLHNGDVEVDTAPGGGALFRLRLPAGEE
jgi:signal transduction histidine kinase